MVVDYMFRPKLLNWKHILFNNSAIRCRIVAELMGCMI